MVEPSSPELKISKDPGIQSRVKQQEQTVRGKYPEISEHAHVIRKIARTDVAAALRIERLRTRRQKAEEESVEDPLTKLPNRRWFVKELEIKIAYAKRTKKPLWLLILDLDNLSGLNTQYTHSGGDRILKLVADLPYRKEEPIARMGTTSDEFGELINEEITEEAVVDVIRRYAKVARTKGKVLLEEMARNDIPDDQKIKGITFSFGLTEYIPGESPDDFMSRADIALYEAKRTGKNRAVIAHSASEEHQYNFREIYQGS